MLSMKRFAAVVGVLVVSALAVPMAAQGGRMVERQFEATWSGTYQPDPTHTCLPRWNTNIVLAESVGKFIGRADLRVEACVNPATGQAIGTALYTAANGDQLGFDFDGMIVGALDPMGETLITELPATNVFGTGRFASVELGEDTGMAVDYSNPAAGTSYGYVIGSIVFDASNRNGK